MVAERYTSTPRVHPGLRMILIPHFWSSTRRATGHPVATAIRLIVHPGSGKASYIYPNYELPVVIHRFTRKLRSKTFN